MFFSLGVCSREMEEGKWSAEELEKEAGPGVKTRAITLSVLGEL